MEGRKQECVLQKRKTWGPEETLRKGVSVQRNIVLSSAQDGHPHVCSANHRQGLQRQTDRGYSQLFSWLDRKHRSPWETLHFKELSHKMIKEFHMPLKYLFILLYPLVLLIYCCSTSYLTTIFDYFTHYSHQSTLLPKSHLEGNKAKSAGVTQGDREKLWPQSAWWMLQ